MMRELAAFQARLATPFAVLGVRTCGAVLTDIEYLPPGAPELAPLDRVAERTCRQLERWLDDPGFAFDLPCAASGTPFQIAVWRAIAAVPVGATCTYGELAKRLRTAPRAVGNACGANRLPIVIPCHRVVGAGGLGGFMQAAAGFPLDVKRWLLAHESR